MTGTRWARRALPVLLLVLLACAGPPEVSPATTDLEPPRSPGSSTPVSAVSPTTGTPPTTGTSTAEPSTSSAPPAGSAAVSSPPPPTGAAPPPPCRGVRCLSVAVTGDVLLHEPLWEQAVLDGDGTMDFAPLFAAQRPYLADADVAICHLETPLAPADGPFQGYPNFVVPPQVLDGLTAAGYDACTTASNHSADAGTDGIHRTLDALDAAGLVHAGTSRTAEEAVTARLVRARGGVVGLVSATYDLNGHRVEHPWQVDLLDPAVILARAEQARAAGADVVVVALHHGVEYQAEPTAGQQELAATLLASPAVDLVYGHHAHVVQPVQRVGEKWAIHGLGNMVAAHAVEDLGNREGLLVRVDFVQEADGSWTSQDLAWVPSLVHDEPPYRWCSLVSGQVCSDPESDRVSLERITAVVNSLGADTAGAFRLPS